jgi:tetratricopeptide (TPR) repeat protein
MANDDATTQIPTPGSQADLARLAAAVKEQPESSTVWLRLAEALERRGFVERVYRAYARAFELDPSSTPLQLSMGQFLLNRGELDDAERMFRMAAASGTIESITGIGAVFEHRGELDAAIALVDRFDEGLDHSMSLRLLKARMLIRKKRADDAVSLLVASKIPTDPNAQTYYYHALGDAHEAAGQADAAFAAWTHANQLRGLKFDPVAHSRNIDRLIERHTEETLASLPKAPPGTPLPILIVGLPRSGTSLVEQILSSHPDVHGAGELDDLRDLSLTYTAESQASVNEASMRYLRRISELSHDEKFVTDKMPHNFMHLGAAAQILPMAHVVHCRRNLMDVGLSCFSKHFGAFHNYACDLNAMGHFFKEYLRMMEHWLSVSPLPIFEVQYEELVSDPNTTIRNLVDFCGLSWDPAVLNFHESKRIVSTASYDQVRKPLYKSAMGRAEQYKAHLEPLRRALKV